MSDLAHIKTREQDWATGLGLQFYIFINNCRQEEVAKRSLQKTINSKGKPEQFRDLWEEKLQGCTAWGAQKLIDFSDEFAAIGVRRNTDITRERCDNWRKWSAEAMDNGAKRAFRYAKEGAPDPIAGVKDPEGTLQCAPREFATIFAEGWKDIWNKPWEDPHGGFGPIPIEEIKRSKAITGRKL
eukprot:2266132-Heterocapsa_arctica.AAC.1